MIFTSFNFLIFFPVVAILFYLAPIKWRWLILLTASLFFYINIKPVYALLLIGVICSTYFFTRLIANTGNESRKVLYLTFNVIFVLLPLFFFKYFSVTNNYLLELMENWNLRWPLPEIQFILPIGISFYTFMAIGYTIDVYNEDIEAERNIGFVALFISFFPLILSGPIERARNMIPQFRNFSPINFGNVKAGLKMMLWGYFMKLVVADRIGIYVDTVYNNIEGHNGTSLLIASILYPFQVYADLGGYSLIAIGVARLMGMSVMHNFRRPFFATSMARFWRRWHISLITWLTDYVYTPLSFSYRKYGLWGIVTALMLTFIIAGIWHGPRLTFIIWGIMQGIFLSIEAFTSKRRTIFERKYNLNSKALYIVICMGITFLLFASSQIFARAASVDDAFMVYRKIFTVHGSPYLDLTTLVYSIFGLLLILIKDFFEEFYSKPIHILRKRRFLYKLSYVILFYLIVFMGVFKSEGSFIYFQF